MSLETDKKWVYRNFVHRNEPVLLQRSNDIKALTLRDILDSELKIVKDDDDMKLVVRSDNHIWSITLTKEK